jgi:hypothetical protein
MSINIEVGDKVKFTKSYIDKYINTYSRLGLKLDQHYVHRLTNDNFTVIDKKNVEVTYNGILYRRIDFFLDEWGGVQFDLDSDTESPLVLYKSN